MSYGRQSFGWKTKCFYYYENDLGRENFAIAHCSTSRSWSALSLPDHSGQLMLWQVEELIQDFALRAPRRPGRGYEKLEVRQF
jgi:hypothetical protein